MYSPYSSQHSSIQYSESEEEVHDQYKGPMDPVSTLQREISEYPQMSFNINSWNMLSTNVLHHDYSINVKFKQIESHKHHLPKTSARMKAQTETAYTYYTNSLNESIKRQIRQNVLNKQSLYPKQHDYRSKSFNLEKTQKSKNTKINLPQFRRIVISPKNAQQQNLRQQPIRRRSCDCSECGVVKKKIFLPPDLQAYVDKPSYFMSESKNNRKNRTFITILNKRNFPNQFSTSNKIPLNDKPSEQQISTSFCHTSQEIIHTHSKSWSFTEKFHPDFDIKLSFCLISKLNRVMDNPQLLAKRTPTVELVRKENRRITMSQLLDPGAMRQSIKSLTKLSKLIERSYQKTPKSSSFIKNYQVRKYTLLKDPYRDLQKLEKGVLPRYLTEKMKSINSNKSNLLLIKRQQMTSPVQSPKQTLYDYVKNMQRSQKKLDSELNTPINKIQTAKTPSIHVNALRVLTPLSITTTPKQFCSMKCSTKFLNSASSLVKPYESIYSKNDIQQLQRRKQTKKDKLAQIIKKK